MTIFHLVSSYFKAICFCAPVMYSRPSVIRPRNLGIENDCFIRVVWVLVYVLLKYFNRTLYINVEASVIWTIHLSENFENKGVRFTKSLLYSSYIYK